MSQSDPFVSHRRKIDEIDEKLLSLLNDRARIVQAIGKIKRSEKAEFYVPGREQAIYERLDQRNSGPFSNQAIRSIFREIISASLSLEEPIRVAFLGPRATFTHLACLQRFGSSVSDFPVDSIKAVFQAVEKGASHFGVVPIENSTEGVVNHTLDLFVDSSLHIFGEIYLEVMHHLLSQADRIEGVKRIYSHPQAIAQCHVFLEKYAANIPITEVSSTARAAELCQAEREAGAIASDLAADLYGIPIIRKRIEDNPNNITRFLVISKKMHHRTGSDKTSVIVSIKDKPGALYEILCYFSEKAINLTKIESRPSKKKAWEYLFHIDMAGHVDEEPIREVFDLLRSKAVSLKVLGSYPMAEGYPS
ncbi:MAG: prephenate dehydratase [Nitrospiria bacterium]